MADSQITARLKTALQQLESERARIEEQIEAILKLVGPEKARAGAARKVTARRAEVKVAIAQPAAEAPAKAGRRKKPHWSPAARAAARERARLMWLERSKKSGKAAAKKVVGKAPAKRGPAAKRR